MSDSKNVEVYRETIALIISLAVVGISLFLALGKNPETHALTLDGITLIMGIFIAVSIHIVMTFRVYKGAFLPRERFCISCGRKIPFDSVICPFCRHDYEN
jgi:hypothetical protein